MKLSGLLVVVLASTFCLSFGGMLPNGDFEIGPSATKLSGTKVEGRYAIPKWDINGFVEYITKGTQQGDMVLVVPEGKHAVRLGNDASISQRVGVQNGKFYAISFCYARTCSQEETLNVSISSINGKLHSGILPLQTIYSNLGYDCYSWGFPAEANEVAISFHNVGHPGEDATCGCIIDAVALTILQRVKPTGGNLVKNGDFGEGPYFDHNSATGVLIPPNVEDDHSPLPSWMVESSKALKYIDSNHFSVPQGQRAVELLGGQETSIAQEIRTTPGETYVLTFLVGDANNKCEGRLGIEAFAGKARSQVTYNSKGRGGFTEGRLFFTPDKTRTRIRFMSLYYSTTKEGSLCGPVLDDVKVLIFRPTRHRSKIHP